jgi:hypothetical protein
MDIDPRMRRELEARRHPDHGVHYSGGSACPPVARIYLPSPDAPEVQAIPAGAAILGVAAHDDPRQIKIYVERPGVNLSESHNLTDLAMLAWARMFEAFLFQQQPDLLGTVEPLVPVGSFQDDPEECRVPLEAIIDVGSFHAGPMRLTIDSLHEAQVAEWSGHPGPELPVSELSKSQAWRLGMEAESYPN